MMKKIGDFLLKKKSWTSDIWIVETSEKCLVWLWVLYLIVQVIKDSILFANVLIVVLEVKSWVESIILKNLPIISKWNLSFLRPVVLLLILTVGFAVLSWLYHKKIKKKIYEKLDNDEFPEYDFPIQESSFQTELVKFLNRDNQIGDNIYWLDGAWGTGKTHFIRTFFEKQPFKSREIYYISCFGIKTRSQAEQVLQSEIEERSRLSIFTSIPVIGSLISWGFSASGLGLMKKDGLVIFDDLERVVYNDYGKDMDNPANYYEPEKVKDNPADYNDILGFIDYLANHKNLKVIVVYNSTDMSETKEKIIREKFVVSSEIFPLTNNAIEKIVHRDKELNEFYKEFLVKLFQLKLAFGYDNARQILAAQDRLRGKDINISEVLSCLNAYVREMHYEGDKNYRNVRHYFFDSFKEYDEWEEAKRTYIPEQENEDELGLSETELEFNEKQSIKNPFYWAIVGTSQELERLDEMMDLDGDTFSHKDTVEFNDRAEIAKKRIEQYENLMAFLWKNRSNYGFCNIAFNDGDYINYQEERKTIDKLKQLLVEIYYDDKNNELKSLYHFRVNPDAGMNVHQVKYEFNRFKEKFKELPDYNITQSSDKYFITQKNFIQFLKEIYDDVKNKELKNLYHLRTEQHPLVIDEFDYLKAELVELRDYRLIQLFGQWVITREKMGKNPF